MQYALIFANGDIDDGPMVRRALESAVDPLTIAADGGARVAQYFGLKIDTVIGDMDSISRPDLLDLQESGTNIVRYPPEKDATDLELALGYAAEHDADWMRIIGGVGGRLDQTLANIYLLGLPILEGRDVRHVAGRQETRLLTSGEHTIYGAPGDTISLVPLGGSVQNVTTTDLHYPLRNETLEFGPARGISNVMKKDAVKVSFNAGKLLLIHTVGRA